jgi:hypothetical protein
MGIAALAIGALWGLHYDGKRAGRAEAEAKQAAAVLEQGRRVDALRQQHAAELRKFEQRLNDERGQSNAKIKRLLGENAQLRDWWAAAVPADAADHAWGRGGGVHDDRDGPVSGGP